MDKEDASPGTNDKHGEQEGRTKERERVRDDRDKENRHRERDNRDRDRNRDRNGDRDRNRDMDRDREGRNRDRGRDNDRERERDRERADDRSDKKRDRGERDNGEPDKVREGTKDKELEMKVKQAEQKERLTGVYIPPFKLAMMMKNVADKSGQEYQRMTWDALKKSINGLINKVSSVNIKNIVLELFRENLIRGKGLFCRSLMRAQHASPIFSNVYAALVAVVNTKLPENGELLLRRLAEQFKKAFRRNDKAVCLSTIRFIAHLSNQQVVGALLPLEVILLLLDKPTDDSVEIAVEFMKEAGQILTDLQPKTVNGVFDRFRSILHEGVSISEERDAAEAEQIDKRVQYMIESLMAIRQSNFAEFPGIPNNLDIVDVENQVTHDITLEENYDIEDNTNYFQFDPNYLAHEEAYDKIKADILGEEESEGEASGDEAGEGDGEESGDEAEGGAQQQGTAQSGVAITDATDTNLINLRRTIYLSIMSSVDFEECAHKLLKVKLPEGQEMELCTMLIECCSQERTYLRFYGLLGQRFCMLNKIYQILFKDCFAKQYAMIHRLETNKLRNVAKFFAHLLHSDALPWDVFQFIRLNEEETTSSSRIFIKILFQEISEYLGLQKLNARLKDTFMQQSYEGLFPKDNPKNTRFAINFFTSIGLGGLTDDLREWLRNAPKMIMQQQKLPTDTSSSSSSDDSDSDSDSSDSSSDSSDTDSSSDSSSSDSDAKRSSKRRRK